MSARFIRSRRLPDWTIEVRDAALLAVYFEAMSQGKPLSLWHPTDRWTLAYVTCVSRNLRAKGVMITLQATGKPTR